MNHANCLRLLHLQGRTICHKALTRALLICSLKVVSTIDILIKCSANLQSILESLYMVAIDAIVWHRLPLSEAKRYKLMILYHSRKWLPSIKNEVLFSIAF